MLQLLGGDVNAHCDIQARGIPGFDLLKNIRDHPLAYLERKRMTLHNWQKLRRKQQTPFRMFPANESFGSMDRASSQIHLRLVEQNKFVLSESAANTLQVFMVAADGKIKA